MDKNRTRTHDIHLRLDDKEYRLLKEHLKKSGLPQQTYLRKLVVGTPPLERPSADFFTFNRELQRIATNMNQIALVANAKGFINVDAYWQNSKELEKLLSELFRVIVLPYWIDERYEDFLRRRKHAQAERDKMNAYKGKSDGKE